MLDPKIAEEIDLIKEQTAVYQNLIEKSNKFSPRYAQRVKNLREQMQACEVRLAVLEGRAASTPAPATATENGAGEKRRIEEAALSSDDDKPEAKKEKMDGEEETGAGNGAESHANAGQDDISLAAIEAYNIRKEKEEQERRDEIFARALSSELNGGIIDITDGEARIIPSPQKKSQEEADAELARRMQEEFGQNRWAPQGPQMSVDDLPSMPNMPSQAKKHGTIDGYWGETDERKPMLLNRGGFKPEPLDHGEASPMRSMTDIANSLIKREPAPWHAVFGNGNGESSRGLAGGVIDLTNDSYSPPPVPKYSMASSIASAMDYVAQAIAKVAPYNPALAQQMRNNRAFAESMAKGIHTSKLPRPYEHFGRSAQVALPGLVMDRPRSMGSDAIGTAMDYLSGLTPAQIAAGEGLPAGGMHMLEELTGTSKNELLDLLNNINADEDLKMEDREGTPRGLKPTLMEHQKVGLTWLKKMEASKNMGGILADDMGLGKTVQTLALIVANRSEDEACKTTLVVAPVALLRQWFDEIKEKTNCNPRLKVYLHHGNDRRHVHWREFARYDIVLTSYNLIGNEWKAVQKYEDRVSELLEAAEGATLTEDQMPLRPKAPFFDGTWYRIVLDEAQMVKNSNTNGSKGVCDLKAMYRWCLSGTPMQNSVDEMHSLIKFLRIKPYNQADRFRRDFSRPLKNGYTSDKKAAMTKLQTLLKAIMLRRTKTSTIDGKPILQLPPKTIEMVHPVFSEDELDFYKQLESKAQVQVSKYLKAGTVGKNYSNILVLLLRLRQACDHPYLLGDRGSSMDELVEIDEETAIKLAKSLAPDVVERLLAEDTFECSVCMELPQEALVIHPCGHFFCRECIVSICETQSAEAIAAGDEGRKGKCPTCRGVLDTKKLVSLNKVREIHGSTLGSESQAMDDLLGLKGDDDDEDNWGSQAEESDGEFDDRKPKKSKGKGKAKAVEQPKQKSRKNQHKEWLEEIKKAGHWYSSAKIDKCVEILNETRGNDYTEKSIVFSQFTSFLDLLEFELTKHGFDPIRYDGSMNAGQRTAAISEFKQSRERTIFLCSLKAGNVGLNLTQASQVIMLDPFWNPYVEDQAIDRAHRIGQTRPVKVHRLTIQGTVEERVLTLQDKKRTLIEAAFDPQALKSIGRLNVRELAGLFGINV
ncbi:hypothetical protein YB2330_001613 [Saitoella coloradoensis]